MQADLIVKNASIYTVDSKQPWAEALAVKDGKLIYVGSNEGAEAIEGPVKDAQGQFIMPGIIDSHVHVAMPCTSMKGTFSQLIIADSKAELKQVLAEYIKARPEMKEYAFYFSVAGLHGEKLTRDDLDEVCSDKPIQIDELEHHTCWMNTAMLRKKKIDDYAKDIAPGLSFYDRDPDGRINGRIYEFAQFPLDLSMLPVCSVEQYLEGINLLLDFWKKMGVIAVFEAGALGGKESIDNFFKALKKLDAEGKLPQYFECCEYVTNPKHRVGAIERLKARDEEFATAHIRARTVKIMFDGTISARTAAVYEPYLDGTGNGGTLLSAEELSDFLLELNEKGVDLHLHTVGERAVGTVLDAVDQAKKQLGDKFTIQVTCAHNELLPDRLLGEFARLGVAANFTPSWFGMGGEDRYTDLGAAIGEKRTNCMYRANSVWNTGALVTFATDYMIFDNMVPWNIYQNIEVGITHQDGNFDSPLEADYSRELPFGREQEKLTMAQMIHGFTLNGAKQLHLDDKIGSLEVGKDASFLIFEKSLFDIDKYQIHKTTPKEVYVRGKLQ